MVKKFEVANRIFTLRTNKGVTQKEVAKAIGITYKSYGKYEQAVNCPNKNNLRKLADYFETTPEYILYGKKVEPETALATLLKDFSSEEQEKIVKAVKEIINICRK